MAKTLEELQKRYNKKMKDLKKKPNLMGPINIAREYKNPLAAMPMSHSGIQSKLKRVGGMAGEVK